MDSNANPPRGTACTEQSAHANPGFVYVKFSGSVAEEGS